MTKKMKTTIAVVSALVIGIGGFTFFNKSKKEESKKDKLKVALILDEGGVNDQSFNQSAWEGALRSKDKHQIEVSYLESTKEADYITNIDTAVDNGSDLIVGIGYKMKNAIAESADNYPDQKFAIIDEVVEKDNVISITFNEEQSGYLVGLIAGEMTKTNKLGFIGGQEVPTVTRFYDGFIKGIKEVNPNAEVSIQFANSFTDAAKGKAIAQQMISKNMDIIFTAGGGVNSGVFEICKETNTYAIGVDSPCNYIAPEIILTSALKNVGSGIEMTIDDVVNGTFQGGKHIVYDMSTPAIDFERTNLIPKDIIEEVEKIKENK